MALNALPIQPNYPVGTKTTPLVRVASFGNNYKLRVKSGLNHMGRVWNVSFNLNKTNRDTLLTFLRNQGATTPFTWTWPTGESFQVVCSDWNENYESYNNYTISATFEEDFTWVS